MRSIRTLLCLAMLSLMAAQSRAASPACTFLAGPSQPIFAGVQSQTVKVVCLSLKSIAHVVRVNLATKGVSLVALTAGSASAQRMLLVSRALRMPNEVGVNANLFTNCCLYSGPAEATALLGLAYSNGVTWSPVGNIPQTSPPPGDFLSSLIVANGRVGIVTLAKGQALPAGLTLAVTGSHRILTAGRNTAPTTITPSDWFGPNARTLVGYAAGPDTAHVWLVTVDSDPYVSRGMTLPQGAALLQWLGATDGLNLDGGGSSTMVRQAANAPATFVNVPKDWPPFGSCQVRVVQGSSCERYVGIGLGVTGSALP